MIVGLCVDELGGDPQAVAGAAHRAFQHMAHTQLPPHLAQVHRAPLEYEGGIARGHMQVSELG